MHSRARSLLLGPFEIFNQPSRHRTPTRATKAGMPQKRSLRRSAQRRWKPPGSHSLRAQLQKKRLRVPTPSLNERNENKGAKTPLIRDNISFLISYLLCSLPHHYLLANAWEKPWSLPYSTLTVLDGFKACNCKRRRSQVTPASLSSLRPRQTQRPQS